jgi:hypothetical protein
MAGLFLTYDKSVCLGLVERAIRTTQSEPLAIVSDPVGTTHDAASPRPVLSLVSVA